MHMMVASSSWSEPLLWFVVCVHLQLLEDVSIDISFFLLYDGSSTSLSCMYAHLAGGLPSVPPAAAAVAPWWSPLNQQLASTRHHLAQVATQLQTASRTWKAPDFSKGLGVKLDIDMLSPAVSSVKQQYQALPEPVRDVMPFAGEKARRTAAALAANLSLAPSK
jgi:hypothetical protein